ncbi:ScpA family protein [Streptomyces solicathayae]|uniref:Segregation and condensation protein A n=1 Tax=Streptomyces solicathayae TaxID=3081768 RepID=A0ABZ0M0P6_9ACTN|nr:ScpA family protein [Streptomyces sp. HUAS YS2]WOX25215.1 ScpA family protein [Streptomyces sp. HUAS YS2]
MPPPPAETSHHPRRRPLGRGPGTPAPPAAAGEGEGEGPAAPGGPEDDARPASSGPAPAEPAVAGTAAEPPAPREGDGASEAGSGPDGPPAGPAPTEPGAAGPSGRETTPSGPAEAQPAAAHDSTTAPTAATAEPAGATADAGRFTVRLGNFEGPFDLLLQLIAKHKLDVTEVALSKVTDEFMAYIRGMGPDWDLDQTTEFLVVAATLLDLKAARLLPSAEVEDEADLALLEARDLLFARLLQYRAYKEIAGILAERWESEGRRYPRTVGLEPHHAELLPEVVISIGAEGFARLAVKAMQPKAKPQVYVDHIHAPLVSVREQAGIVVALLKERGTVSFRELAEDAEDTLTVVARFLALLELYREKAVALDQQDALGDLTVSWTGGDQETRVTDEFDQVTEAME